MQPRIAPAPPRRIQSPLIHPTGRAAFADVLRSIASPAGVRSPLGPRLPHSGEPVVAEPKERGPPFLPMPFLHAPCAPKTPPAVASAPDTAVLLERIVSSLRVARTSDAAEVRLQLGARGVRVALRCVEGRIGATLDAEPGDEDAARRLADALERGLAAREIAIEAIEVR